MYIELVTPLSPFGIKIVFRTMACAVYRGGAAAAGVNWRETIMLYHVDGSLANAPLRHCNDV